MPDQPDEGKNNLPVAPDKASIVPVKIPDHITEMIPAARAIAATMPSYDPDQITDQKLAFVLVWTENLDIEQAAKITGISRSAAFRLSLQPIFVKVFRHLVDRRFETIGLAAAQKALVDIVRDPGCPAPARVTAARTIKEWIDEGETARGDKANGKALSDMTVDELANFIHKFEAGTQLAAQTITIAKQDQ